MLNALEVELDRVQKRSWSFRQNRQDFEFLLPTEMMVSHHFLPNLQQYLRYYTDARDLVRSHNLSLNQLRDACRAAYAQLISDESFKALMSSVPGVDPKYFAEYVVNGASELPSNYSTAEAWNPRSQDFLRIRGEVSLRPAFDSLEHAGDAMRDSVERLQRHLNDAAVSLADAHGLPAAEPAFNGEMG